ncbi:MAG TPA: FliI/YscN family ATPase [Pirellulales bacterium]|jgi:FliI/YscN family ATPase|nr:FliI/YscN family ATPase [Pirellulales bacterium]
MTSELADQLDSIVPSAIEGSIVRMVGMTAAVADFAAPVGALVEIQRHGGESLEAEVVGFNNDLTLVYPYSDMQGVRHGNRVRLKRSKTSIRVGPELLGRVIDARGQCIDGRPQPWLPTRQPLDARPPSPIQRPRIDTPMSTGIRVIDGLLTCGKGQRMGIFAGSGVGKSVTLGMMARYTAADVNVIALVGERGREVNEFLERDLGPEGLAKSVVVVATSDEPALLRTRAAFAATSVAEYFRDQGRDVMLVMDSLTRFALAQREIGLAAGEPPTTRGFPPSVFALLPKLVERAGRGPTGSITAFYSVLVEGDDANEPICDCVRGLIDGHTWLSRKLATRNHYPAVDVLESLSRLMNDITTQEHRESAGAVREMLGAYRDHEDLISIGAYRRGSNRSVDLAIDMLDSIHQFLRQRVSDGSSVEKARAELAQLRAKCIQRIQSAATAAPEGAR